MADNQTKTRELLQQLASTEYRRSMRADQVFRTLRQEHREDGVAAQADKPKKD